MAASRIGPMCMSLHEPSLLFYQAIVFGPDLTLPRRGERIIPLGKNARRIGLRHFSQLVPFELLKHLARLAPGLDVFLGLSWLDFFHI